MHFTRSIVRAIQITSLIGFAAGGCKAKGEASSSSVLDALAGREKRETKYENGQKKEEYTVIKDKSGNYVKDGPSVSFHQSGQKSEEGAFVAGALDGHWQQWDENGKLTLDALYKAGKREGAFKAYEGGNLTQTGNYSADQLNGPFKYFGFDDFVISGEWTTGQPTGSWTIADKAGKARARARFEAGKLIGAVQSLAEDGSVRPPAATKGCADFAGYALETVRWADVIFATLQHHLAFPEDGGVNKFSGGRMLTLGAARLDAIGVQTVTLIFDTEDLLTALHATADKQRGDSAYANVIKQLNTEYAKKYNVVSSTMPFVGDCHGEYRNAGCSIVLDAPHMGFTMDVTLRSATFGKAVAAAP